MLVESLVRGCNDYFERDAQHHTILWFDGKVEWEGLLPHLQDRLPLLVYQGSLLELRYQLVERSPDERAVVYLPFEKLQLTRRGEAEHMRPFIYTSKVFDDSIESVLLDQGIELPTLHAKMRFPTPYTGTAAAPVARPSASAPGASGRAREACRAGRQSIRWRRSSSAPTMR
jgi:hypothetical protein